MGQQFRAAIPNGTKQTINMRREDLLLNLQKLESSLQNIDSATDEVKKTVKASSDLENSVNAYTKELKGISNQYKKLNDALTSSYSTQIDDIAKRLNEIAEKFTQSVTRSNSSLSSKNTKACKEIENSAKLFTDAAMQLREGFEEQVKGKTDAFSASCDKAVTSFETVAKQTKEDFVGQLDKSSKAFSASCDKAVTAFETAANQTKEDFVGQVNKSSETFSESCNEAIISLQKISDTIMSNLDSVSAIKSAVENSQSKMKKELLDENEEIRKSVTVVSVFTVLSMILSFLALVFR